jgi:hypothetical protein
MFRAAWGERREQRLPTLFLATKLNSACFSGTVPLVAKYTRFMISEIRSLDG